MGRLEFEGTTESLQKVEYANYLGFIASGATEAAAIAAANTAGRGDKKGSDQEAVDIMRKYLSQLNIDATVVIGEGEKDEAPMLYIGERVGNGNGPKLDIAVDPLEGTDATAALKERASSVLAITEQGGIARLHSRIHYMDKLIVGPEAKDEVDIDAPAEHNIRAIAKALDRKPSDITVVILNRPRNSNLIGEVRATGARVKAIEYGDLIPGVLTAIRGSGIHAVMGIGGAPEGVLTAAALKGLHGDIQTRVWAGDESKITELRGQGVDLNRIYRTHDLVPGQTVAFSATAVTDNGSLLEGVRLFGEGTRTNTMVICTANGSVNITQKDTVFAPDSYRLQYRI